MRHLGSVLLAAVAVALLAAPADARDAHRDAVVAPANAKWLGEFWAQIYSLPESENPFAGNGRCLSVGHKVVQAAGAPCTISTRRRSPSARTDGARPFAS
jgi:hypothetical protein